jgi:hypothetical protein
VSSSVRPDISLESAADWLTTIIVGARGARSASICAWRCAVCARAGAQPIPSVSLG